ncbi:MAG: aryl-sulfate sulfohydrolase [Phycisphaerae bacterium]|nr:aryl-sulfate sulfohydrolase [Phycisphaerae bacterium]
MIRFSEMTAVCTLVSSVVCGGGTEPSERPDILLIVIDDLGCRDLGVEGHPRHLTPAIDGLASESVRFTEAYCNGPNCSPSRAALFTGRHGSRTGVHTVGSASRGKPEERKVDPPASSSFIQESEVVLSESLAAAGYRTGFVGKWHISDDPLDHGFERNVGGWRLGHPKSYFPPYKNPALEDGEEGEYLVDRLGRETVSMIRDFEADTKGRPWFVTYSPYAVHTPIQAPEDAVEEMKKRHPGISNRAARYAVMVERTDAAVAEILAAVDPESTVVCFVSDNGGLQPVTDMAPYRGGKGMLFDGGIRTPMYVRGPGLEPRTVGVPVQVFDLHPTLLDLASVPRPEGVTLDARSLQSLLEDSGGETAELRGPIHWHFPAYLEGRDPESREPERRFRTTPAGAIRDGRWKLVEWFEDGQTSLFDLESDPGETTDVGDAHPEVRERLLGRLRGWRLGIDAPMPRPR